MDTNKENTLNNYVENNKVDISNIGNFTANAVKDFEKNIVSQHNYLEKTGNKQQDKG